MNSLLRFSPTGNFVPDPYVIVCGKTADESTQGKFWDQSRSGDPTVAAHEMIFSDDNTREMLYKELIEIGLFDLLRKVKPDAWEGLSDREGWNRLFQGDKWQEDHGIQLTQACNCAILWAEDTKRPSQQPTKATVRVIAEKNPSCLFNSFPDPERLTNLKLVIFLDTPSSPSKRSGGKWEPFHQVEFFDDAELGRAYKRKGIEIISIPHPSGLSRRGMEPGNLSGSTKVGAENALRLFEEAKATINEIMKEIEET